MSQSFSTDPHHHKFFFPDIQATKGTKVTSSGIICVPPQSGENDFTATKDLNLNTTCASKNLTTIVGRQVGKLFLLTHNCRVKCDRNVIS